MIEYALIANLLLLLDYGQTKYIADNPQRYEELNPLLGKHPSSKKVDQYFATAFLLTNGVAYALGDDKKRKKWYLVVGAVEGITVARNASIGIKFSF